MQEKLNHIEYNEDAVCKILFIYMKGRENL